MDSPQSCYTCNLTLHPRAQDYLVHRGTYGNLHLDLKNRPMFIFTPHLHVPHADDLPPDILHGSVREIRHLMTFVAKTANFQVMFSYGTWLHHKHHQHFKIKIDETLYARFKNAHLEKTYKASASDSWRRRDDGRNEDRTDRFDARRVIDGARGGPASGESRSGREEDFVPERGDDETGTLQGGDETGG